LLAILIVVGIIKLLAFGASVHNGIVHNNPNMAVGFSILGGYLVFHFLGIISAARERTCGLKMFSVTQTILVVVSLAGMTYFIWTHAALFSQFRKNLGNDQPSLLKEYNGQDVLLTTQQKPQVIDLTKQTIPLNEDEKKDQHIQIAIAPKKSMPLLVRPAFHHFRYCCTRDQSRFG